ncbi:MAG TPA: DUF2958 domain-containing protein [Desulfosporosinus sp.]|nr:DUF2958 domain-containing protein [Desulfosporosinus sp.]
MGRQEYEPPVRRQLVDKETLKKLLTLEIGEKRGLQAVAQVKLYLPDNNWFWYASAFDGQDLLFGLVVGTVLELGYFSLSELEEIKGPKGELIKRDEDFEPTLLRDLKRKHKQEKDSS